MQVDLTQPGDRSFGIGVTTLRWLDIPTAGTSGRCETQIVVQEAPLRLGAFSLMHSNVRCRITLLIGGVLVFGQLGLATAKTLGPEDVEEDSSVGPAASQTPQPVSESRQEEYRQMREERKQQVQPPKQEIWEKYLYSFDQKGNNSFEDLNFWGFHPRLDWIARGSGAAGGVRYWNPDALGPIDVMGSAFYSWRRYQHYDFQMGLIPNRGKKIPSKSFETEEIEKLGDVDQEGFSRFKLYASGRFRDRTDDSYYGSGPDTNKEDRLRYRVKDVLAEGVTGYQFSERFGFTFKGGFIGHSLACGRSSPNFCELPPSPEPPGQFNPPNYVRLHTSFLLDFRDNPGVPHKGYMLAFGWEKWDNQNTNDLFNFNRFTADMRGFIPLGSRQRVIALRGHFVNSDPAPDNRVPFFLQPSLGGGESLRGFDAYRFQGDKLMLVQAEYRWEASRRFEFALFGDTGTVADRGDRISVNKLKSDWGIGFRFKTSRSTLLRIDQAFSNEGPITQFRVSASF